MKWCTSEYFINGCKYVTLRDMVPFAQFKKHKKRPWRSVNFSKGTGRSLKLY